MSNFARDGGLWVSLYRLLEGCWAANHREYARIQAVKPTMSCVVIRLYWLTGLRRDVEIKTSEPEIADNLIDHPLWEMVLFPGWEMDMEAFAYLISSLPPRMTPEEFLVLCWIHNFWVPAFSMAKSLWSYQMLHYIWVNYNDLTTTSLEIMVSKGNHPQMALIQVRWNIIIYPDYIGISHYISGYPITSYCIPIADCFAWSLIECNEQEYLVGGLEHVWYFPIQCRIS